MKRFLLLFLIVSAPVFGQSNRDGRSPVDDGWRKSSGNLEVTLVLTDEPQKVMADWKKPEPPVIKDTSVATRGKPIVAFIIFTGCAEVQGRCKAEVDYVVLKPDGSTYATESSVSLWKYQAPPTGKLQLSEGYLGVIIEPQDPAGTYQVQATVRDLNANLDVVMYRSFVVER